MCKLLLFLFRVHNTENDLKSFDKTCKKLFYSHSISHNAYVFVFFFNKMYKLKFFCNQHVVDVFIYIHHVIMETIRT